MNEHDLQIESVLKFLDCAKRTVEQEAKDSKNLDNKCDLFKTARQLQDARHILRVNYYAFSDWCKSGEYQRPIRN